jgi:hypothetical protein
MELGEHLGAFFPQPFIENRGVMVFCALARQKNKFFTDMHGLLNP